MPRRHPARHSRQRGMAILIVLAMIGLGAAWLLAGALGKANVRTGRDKITTDALAQARTALIGYAVTYGDTHTTEVHGHLLLPDLGSTRNSSDKEGASAGNFAGNASNLSVVGRLPWRTLGLGPMRDDAGECLWYAVSGAFQDAQKSALMNWDTVGQFDVHIPDGAGGATSAAAALYHQRAVAVVFAAGPALPGQNRAASADTVAECGGNYDARNYLDAFSANPPIGGITNHLANLNGATGTYSLAAPKSLISGPISDTGGAVLVNDRILIITPDDLFGRIKKRSDFAAFVNQGLLDAARNNLSSLPPPGRLDFTGPAPVEISGGVMTGNLEIGRVPKAALTSNALKKWQDNLLYARCISGGDCLTVNGAGCHGVIVFAGERTAAQTRASNTQKNTWSNYLEGSVLDAFNAGAVVFIGAPSYSPAMPSADVLACIP
ncbi:MAG: hypothetical protein PHX38_03590 [Sulfuricella sp.]|nr:hypothetical protein [Sulfuricella sp.]